MNIKFGLASIFILIFSTLTACGGGGKGGAVGGGATSLATGTFTQSFAPTATSDNILPFGDGTFADVKHQILYTAAEVGATGLITAVRFQYRSTLATTVTCPNTTVRLGHSNLFALSSNFAGNIDRSSLQTVFSDATLTIPPGSAGDWFTITFATPFHYNGLDNLVVEVERTTTCNGNVRIATINAAGNRRAESEAADTLAGFAQHDATTAGTVDVVQALQQFVFAGGDNRVSYSGAASSNAIPFVQSNLPELRHVQLLYHANEMNGSGPITGIALVQNQPTSTAAGYVVTVKLGHTTLSTLTNTFAGNFGDAPAVVASGLTINVPGGIPAGRPIWIPLTGAFIYNGTDNLIVDIEVTGPPAASNFMRGVALSGRRLYAAVGAAIGTVDNVGYDALFRFHGGTMDVMPAVNVGASQPLGGPPSGGQIQNLYRSTYLGTGGTVTSVAFRLSPVTAPGAATVPNYQVHMGHTNKATLNPADTYESNMDENALVYSGTLVVPASARAGDWITIPLTTPFVYDPSRNLVVRFAGDNSGVSNTASAHSDATEFPSRSVGKNNNTAGNPSWDFDGAVNVRFGIQK